MTRGGGWDDDRKGQAVQPPLNKVQVATHVSLATHTQPTLVPDKPTPQPAILGMSSSLWDQHQQNLVILDRSGCRMLSKSLY